MDWEIIQKDFSVFQTDEGKAIYTKGNRNKLIIIPYATTDLVSFCLLAKKDHIINENSHFLPKSVHYKIGGIFKYDCLAENFIYDFSYAQMSSRCKKELTHFNLVQKQVPDRVLIKSFNEQLSTRYLDTNLHWFDGEFLFIKKEKIPALISYIHFLEDKPVSFVEQGHGEDLFAKTSTHSDILHAKDIPSIMTLMENPIDAFNFAMNIPLDMNQNKLINCQLQFIRTHLGSLIKQAQSINPLYKRASFYSSNDFCYFENVPVRPFFEINQLRAEILSCTDDECFLSDTQRYLNDIKSVYTLYKEEKEINTQTIAYLEQYYDSFNKRYPFFKEANKMISDIYTVKS